MGPGLPSGDLREQDDPPVEMHAGDAFEVPTHRRWRAPLTGLVFFSDRPLSESVPPSHVLVPLDGSPLADEALTHALGTFECPITVLNVVTPVDTEMSEGGVLEPDDQRHTVARKRARRLIEQAEDRAAGEGRTINTTVETGDPVETILSYVDDQNIDHVVMGGHGGQRGQLTRRLLGTVSTAVVGEAPVTVTVVRSGREGFNP